MTSKKYRRSPHVKRCRVAYTFRRAAFERSTTRPWYPAVRRADHYLGSLPYHSSSATSGGADKETHHAQDHDDTVDPSVRAASAGRRVRPGRPAVLRHHTAAAARRHGAGACGEQAVLGD